MRKKRKELKLQANTYSQGERKAEDNREDMANFVASYSMGRCYTQQKEMFSAILD